MEKIPKKVLYSSKYFQKDIRGKLFPLAALRVHPLLEASSPAQDRSGEGGGSKVGEVLLVGWGVAYPPVARLHQVSSAKTFEKNYLWMVFLKLFGIRAQPL